MHAEILQVQRTCVMQILKKNVMKILEIWFLILNLQVTYSLTHWCLGDVVVILKM